MADNDFTPAEKAIIDKVEAALLQATGAGGSLAPAEATQAVLRYAVAAAVLAQGKRAVSESLITASARLAAQADHEDRLAGKPTGTARLN